MSGICDMCKRTTCEYRADDIAVCGLPKTETNWERLFGKPERAARTLHNGGTLICRECLIREECAKTPEDSNCMIMDNDALLEWLRGGSDGR